MAMSINKKLPDEIKDLKAPVMLVNQTVAGDPEGSVNTVPGNAESPSDGTAASPASGHIHKCHIAVIRFGKGLLGNALKVGAELQKVRRNRGDDFDAWVDTQLSISHEDAEIYLRFFDESSCHANQLSPAIEVKLPRICKWLGILSNKSGNGSATTGATENTVPAGSKQSKATAVDDDCESPQREFPDVLEEGSRLGVNDLPGHEQIWTVTKPPFLRTVDGKSKVCLVFDESNKVLDLDDDNVVSCSEILGMDDSGWPSKPLLVYVAVAKSDAESPSIRIGDPMRGTMGGGESLVAAQPTLPLTPETAASSFSPFPNRSLPAASSEDKTEPQPTRDSPRFASVDPVQHGRGIGPEAGCQQDSPPDV